MTFEQLRQKHQQFIYQGFKILHKDESLKIIFDFLITPDIKFNPTIVFPKVSKKRLEEISPKVLEDLLFNLGMIELISYWKCTCSPEIIIKAGYLDKDQIKFWKNLLIKGLGEFFYTNKIDFTRDSLVNFKSNSHLKSGKLFNKSLQDRDLILVGGGKDSVVTLDSIKNSNRDFNYLMLNPTKASIKITEISGCKKPIIIKRIIDPKLLKLNQLGYLNGHTPFSAYLAFLATLAACLYDYKNIVVSNEASSNEGNIRFHGQIVNHQYSKSFEFEKDFREYSKKYLSTNSSYYSFLRSLNELEIARKFASLKKYHKIFRSCNLGSQLDGIWCGECSKCLFSYLILYPFLGVKLKAIFGKDLLNDESLSEIMEELLQVSGKFKPFECVGTKEEIQYALLISIINSNDRNLPRLLKKYKSKLSILVLGLGREGRSTLELLSKILPKNKIGIADQNKGKDYLEKIKDYDVIIKSPGIPYFPELTRAKEQGKIITSATQIFFDIFKGKIIGVTGTKGKSTNASLIYDILKAEGLDVHLVGNIGKPVLDVLADLDENSIVVFELSSFQLEDLNKSPHIAVITNLYPEHLDHHGDFENYKNAKFNITKYQTKNDYFIYNNNTTELKEFSKKTLAKTLPFSDSPIFIIGHLFKVPNEKISQAIKNFKSLPHRLEFIGEFKSIKFYNDSLATIPQATIRALDILDGDVETLIAGGFDRGIDYSILGPAIDNSKIENLILFPTTGEKISKVVSRDVKIFNVDNMKDAVKIAFEKTSPGKIVLLSPASSSFNLFKDYEDRGNQFKDLVSQI